MNMAPGVAFTTLNFLCNLMGKISLSVVLHSTGKITSDKQSFFSGIFISFEENEVL
jgi:hypothetical protein